MKKVWLLITVLLIYGCGGGGGGGSTEAQPPSDLTGNVVVNIIDGTQKAEVNSALKAEVGMAPRALALPPAARLRLVITNPHIKIDSKAYKKIIDGNMVSTLNLEFPIANGYVFELVTYTQDTVNPPAVTPVVVNRILQYAKDTVDITSSGAVVNLTLQPITATFTISDPVISGDLLNTVSSIPSPTPLQPAWKLFQSTTDILNALHSTSGATTNHATDKALIASTAGQLCVQGEFYINNNLLDTNGTLTILDTDTVTPVPHTAEHNSGWTLNYPNPEFGDAPYCVTLNLIPVVINP